MISSVYKESIKHQHDVLQLSIIQIIEKSFPENQNVGYSKLYIETKNPDECGFLKSIERSLITYEHFVTQEIKTTTLYDLPFHYLFDISQKL